MTDLLSLNNDLIYLVGKHVITSPKAGLRAWCRATSTCKRLWNMQLPESSSERLLDMDEGIEGESKAEHAWLAQYIWVRISAPICCACANDVTSP